MGIPDFGDALVIRMYVSALARARLAEFWKGFGLGWVGLYTGFCSP